MTGQWDESNDLNLKFVGKYEIRTANYWFKIRWMKIRDIEMTLKSYQGADVFCINMLKGYLTYYQYTQFLWLQRCGQWKMSSASHLQR